MRRCASLLALAVTATLLTCCDMAAPPTAPATAASQPAALSPVAVMDAGPLRVEIHISRTATVFHVVDQLSLWSEFCHRQYRAWFEALDGGLSPDDLQLLAEHAAIRKAHGWSGGLEQTLYSPLDLDDALAAGMDRGHLTAEEAATERRVLEHFAPRVEELMRRERPTLEACIARLQSRSADIESYARVFARFCGCAQLTIPVYLIANPDDRTSGGGYGGGRMTLEIPRQYDIYPTFLHETFHAFLRTKQGLMEQTARSAEGLNTETLGEGFAYALNPGIIHSADGGDPLGRLVADDIKAQKPLSDSYTRFHRLGLAMRPLLDEALKDPNAALETFLPRAVDAWRVVWELEKAKGADWDSYSYRTDPTPCLFMFGPNGPGRLAYAKMQQAPRNGHVFSRPHDPAEYRKAFDERSKPGDTVVLLLALDDAGRVPEDFHDLLPGPWVDVEARLKDGKEVFLKYTAREMNIVLLAAPTVKQLEQLIRRSDWIPLPKAPG